MSSVEVRRRRVLVTGATGFLGRNVLRALGLREELTAVAACRQADRLPPGFRGEVRVGDLRNPDYRARVVEDVDVVCHTGTWSSLYGHAARERANFLEPTLDLIERSIRSGVERFVMTGTMATSAAVRDGSAVGDFAPGEVTGFWPHLDALVEVSRFMQQNCRRGTGMVEMRLGHFVGAGNALGLIPVLVPRLRTRLVPFIAHGRHRVALVADTDLGEAFALAVVARDLDEYDAFNICGPEFPTMRAVLQLIAEETGFAMPWFSVSPRTAHAFGWLMEALHPVLPGKGPFLTRSIVHLAEDWFCPNDHATEKLGYSPKKDWRVAVRESLAELRASRYPWPRLAQAG